MAFGDVVAYPSGNVLTIDLIAFQQGQSCINQLGYVANIGSPQSAVNISGFASTFKATVWDLMKAELVDGFLMSSFRLFARGIKTGDANKQNIEVAIGETGTKATEAMPAWTTIALTGQPANDPIYSDDPAQALFERTSYYRFSGMPESAQNNGIIDALAQLNWGVIAANMRVINDGAVDWTLRIPRPENTLVGGNQKAFTEVSFVGVRGRVSSMLSRK